MSWETVQIKDICKKVTSGGTPLTSKENYYFPRQIPWIKTKEVNFCRITDAETYISQEGLDNSSAKLIPANSVIIAMYGQGDTAGRVAINKIPVATNQACCNLIVDESKADYRFVYYKLSTMYAKLVSLKNGGAQPNLNAAIIKSLEISIPNLEVQHIIADILTAYDDLIENNYKQIKLLEEAAQRLYKEWFVDLRFPGHEIIPVTDGIPEGWKRDEVNSIIDLLSGFAFKSADFTDVGAYKIVTIKNVQDGMFDGHNVSRIAEVPTKMPKHCYLNDGDILLSLTGNVGRVCVVNGNNYLLNQRVAKLKSDYPAFAYCLFRSNDMFVEMGNLANGAAQQNLSPIKTGQIKILIPPVELLIHFEEVVTVYMKQMLNLNEQIELLQETRDRLLPKLMNGEIEV